MKLAVNFQGGTRYEITSGNHRVITDQPVADGGQDTGMSPVELFVGSMASCVGYFVGRFCSRHDIPLDGLKEALRDSYYGKFATHVPHRITPELKDKLLRVAHGCTVHQSIVVTPNISITLNPHRHHEVAK